MVEEKEDGLGPAVTLYGFLVLQCGCGFQSTIEIEPYFTYFDLGNALAAQHIRSRTLNKV